MSTVCFQILYRRLSKITSDIFGKPFEGLPVVWFTFGVLSNKRPEILGLHKTAWFRQKCLAVISVAERNSRKVGNWYGGQIKFCRLCTRILAATLRRFHPWTPSLSTYFGSRNQINSLKTNLTFSYGLLTAHHDIILVNNQLDAQLFSVCIYFDILHVSSNHVLIIRRIDCIITTSVICHSM